MSKILLTSCGLNPTLKDTFLSCLDKDVAKVKLLFVITASKPEKDKQYVQWDIDALIECGVLKENITLYDIGQPLNINTYDILYVVGGNTLYLMDQIRKYRFDEVIKSFIQSNRLYVGNSAGCIILCPTIKTSKTFDENIVNLKNWVGLGIIDYQVVPHANFKEEYLAKIKGQYPKILALNDDEGFLIQQ